MRDYRLKKVHCNRCGSEKSGDELDVLETIFVGKKITLTICPDCYEDIDDKIKTCPLCDVQVHVDEIADTGKCPCCGFVEQEHTGSSWI
jgi:predicted RNA-binding Zn-ribbon protein involved in translation (DUF1610 family)